MTRYRSQGLLAVGIGLAVAACGEPDLNTNLRPEGAPEVLALLTQNPIDWDGNGFTETALKCRYVNGVRDPKAPAFVGDPITGGSLVCPETQAEFDEGPDHLRSVEPRIIDGVSWGLRVMFDELLDGDHVEDLIGFDDEGMEHPCNADDESCEGTLARTQPFTLACGATPTELAYDGFYVPNGNNVTFPLGPSLFLRPANIDDLTFPTGSPCKLTMKPEVIIDKDGESVPASDPGVSNNYQIDFKIADLALLLIDPSPGGVVSPDPVAAGAAAFVFNASIASDDDGLPLNPKQFVLRDGDGNEIPTFSVVSAYFSGDLTDAVYLFPDTDTGIFLPGDYTAVMKAGTVTEVNGGTLETAEETTSFSVPFAKTGQTSGTDFVANGAIRISFNNSIDPTSVSADDFEFFQTNPPTTPPNAPVAFTVAVGNSTSAALANIDDNALVFTPTAELPIGTYALRIKAGTEIKDVDGNTATFAAPLGLSYVVQLKSTHSIPGNAGTLASTGNFEIVFSGTLDMASVTTDDFTFMDTTTMAAPVAVPFTLSLKQSTSRPAPNPPSHPNDTVVIDPDANLTAGHTYQVTLKQGAQIKSASGVTRTFGAPPGTASNRTQWNFTAN
jgi:hypothetical protein